MKRTLLVLIALALVAAFLPACQGGGKDLAGLAPGSRLAGFEVRNLYEDGSGRVMGGRLISERHGFIVDLLRIQSVPQGFFWVKTVPEDDRGEAHACEHLLLGKGRQGRYVAALEEMTLGSSTAWTSQLNTVYHFNTLAGEEGFYQTLEARLSALLNPDFTDEEIRREVCHIGASEDPATGKLVLEEKGTVFTEMVSSFEGPDYPLWGTAGDLLFGKDHPLANSSGGHPDSMRTMKPQNLRDFHRSNYRPAHMGLIAALPREMSVELFLTRLGGILDRAWPAGDRDDHPGMRNFALPPTSPAPRGQIRAEAYPSENPEDPGRVLLAWTLPSGMSAQDAFLLEIFAQSLAGGPGTPLYDAFVNSATRRLTTGANEVFAWMSENPGEALFLGVNGLGREFINVKALADVREIMLAEIGRLHDLPDNSDALSQFNEQAASRLADKRKALEQALSRPPMFGYRQGNAGYWQDLLGFLERDSGFHKSLVFAPYLARADSLLGSGHNVWRDAIDAWGLLAAAPEMVGAAPSAELLEQAKAGKAARLAGFVADCRHRYGLEDDQAAIARFKQDFDAVSAELEAKSADDVIPRFTANPPLTLDDQLDYEVFDAGGPQLVASTFDNMRTATLGLAFRLGVLPADHLMSLAVLPEILTEVGVIKDQERIDYSEMSKRLRREVTEYEAYFDTNPESGRAELVLKGSAAGAEEMKALLAWMTASLWSPDLEAENLPRLRDVVDQSLTSLRSRMQGSEESWVGDPASAYRYQSDPVYLSAASFLTRAHHLLRLKWLLREAPSYADGQALVRFLDDLAAKGAGGDRDACLALLDAASPPAASEEVRALGEEIVTSLRQSLSDIPDDALAGDWAYLCGMIKEDLLTPPAVTLAKLRADLGILLKADNARLFMISSRGDREAALPGIRALCARLDTAPSRRQEYARDPRIAERLQARSGLNERPLYVGLVNENTRNGTLIFTARNAGIWDANPDKVLDALAGKLYGGGGGHGIFMKTWAAGLAYSNGYGYGDRSGMTSYYAERCPDIAQTMRFVVDLLNDAKVDEHLVEYAVALAFGQSRAAGPYEQRGEAMAADLADGVGPERVREYRHTVLSLRKEADLSAKLASRMKNVYGQVLVGYGAPLAQSKDGVFFIIGPEEQFTALEQYLAVAEGPQTVSRLYPRDFWLVN